MQRRTWSDPQRALAAVFAIVAVCCLIGLAAIADYGRADGNINPLPDRTIHPFLAEPDRSIAVLHNLPLDAEDHLVNNDADRARFDTDNGLFDS